LKAQLGIFGGINWRIRMLERVSIELTNQCGKHCSFCYNHSSATGGSSWTVDELVSFVKDCAANGLQAVSLGGGEPLEYPGVFEVFERLRGILFRSMTSNGLLLQGEILEKLVKAAPDKVHLSIHFPQNATEVDRVIRQVHELAGYGIRSGVNLLVARSNLAAAQQATEALLADEIGHDRIVFLPMRGADTPTPQQIAQVAGGWKFQSMSCLAACGRSPRFCSISWDKQVGWCSYTMAKRGLRSLTAAGLEEALEGLPLVFCGGTEERQEVADIGLTEVSGGTR
jgi:sulfatase maturation enzyme AslB (radical SAM superfamily)